MRREHRENTATGYILCKRFRKQPELIFFNELNLSMIFTDELEKIFVNESDIPEQYALTKEVHQREYLCNGEMIAWDGKVHEVFSPICINTPDGLQRKLIGTYPIGTESPVLRSLVIKCASKKILW